MPLMSHSVNPDYIAKIKAMGPVHVQELQIPIPGPEGELVSQISFREPTAGDVLMHGSPVIGVRTIGEQYFAERDQVAYFEMMQALSGIGVPFLMRMSPNDLLSCEAALDRFFIQSLRTRLEESSGAS